MYNLKRFFICFILILSPFSLACAENYTGNSEKISALLFPETASWMPISSTLVADTAFLRKVEPELKKVYLRSKIGGYRESENCSFIERIFSADGELLKYFHLNDHDIIYAGPSYCDEGDATVIWFETKNGYVIKQKNVPISLVLRVQKGESLAMASVDIGCCDSVVDEYFLGTLPDLKQLGHYTLTKDLHLPVAGITPIRFKAVNKLVLWNSLEKNYKRNKSLTERVGNPVLGNMLAKYLPGCSGKILAEERDQQSKWWYLVGLDKDCDKLKTYAPFGVNVGWAAADENNLKEAH